jgi:uncharacterized protein with von Willebrand factor type A (vWA) domain
MVIRKFENPFVTGGKVRQVTEQELAGGSSQLERMGEQGVDDKVNGAGTKTGESDTRNWAPI